MAPLPQLLLLLLLLGHAAGGGRAARERPRAPLRINCGGGAVVDQDGLPWEKDMYYVGGSNALAASFNEASLDSTLRVFGVGEISCYHVPVVSGRYLIRVSFAYDNFDGLDNPPAFGLFLEGVLVEEVDLKVREGRAHPHAYYTDFYAEVADGVLNLCLQPRRGNPVINTLQLFPASSMAYRDPELTFPHHLSSHVRLNSGGGSIKVQGDPGYRTWLSDEADQRRALRTDARIAGTSLQPDLYPERLFQSARVAGDANRTGYTWWVKGLSELNGWIARLHFAEIDGAVGKGDRVFDIELNGNVIRDFDILSRTGGVKNKAHTVSVPFNFTIPTHASPYNLRVSLTKSTQSTHNPIIAGVEVLEVIPVGVIRENVEAEIATFAGENASPYLVAAKRIGMTSAELTAILIASLGLTSVIGMVVAFLIMWRSQRRGVQEEVVVFGPSREPDESDDGIPLQEIVSRPRDRDVDSVAGYWTSDDLRHSVVAAGGRAPLPAARVHTSGLEGLEGLR